MIFGRQVIKSFFQTRLGLDVHRFTPSSSPTAQIVSSFRKFDIDLVLDVGANQGQFALELRSGGYAGNIVSFEPLSSVFPTLKRVSEDDDKWTIHPRCAVGSKNVEVEINIAGNSASSSLLPMLDSHLLAAPHTAYIGKESVPSLTLDSIAPDYLKKFKNTFLKIDTQGFEWDVLNGAQNILPNIRGVLLELSLVPLYEGQHLWREMIDQMEATGFSLWALQPGFTDAHSGQTLQADGIFFRP